MINAPSGRMRWARRLQPARSVLRREVLGTARDTGLIGSRLGLPLRTGVPNPGARS